MENCSKQNLSFVVSKRLYFVFLFSEYLLPEGDEALSDDAERAISSILVPEVPQRPGAKGL